MFRKRLNVRFVAGRRFSHRRILSRLLPDRYVPREPTGRFQAVRALRRSPNGKDGGRFGLTAYEQTCTVSCHPLAIQR